MFWPVVAGIDLTNTLGQTGRPIGDLGPKPGRESCIDHQANIVRLLALGHRQTRLKLVPESALPYTLFYVYPIESFIMQVSKWGNSLAVRLPVSLVQELGIADGDELVLQPAPRQAAQAASVSVTRLPSKLERLQAVRHLRGSLGVDFAFDRDEANAR